MSTASGLQQGRLQSRAPRYCRHEGQASEKPKGLGSARGLPPFTENDIHSRQISFFSTLDIVDRVNVAEMTIASCNEALMVAFVFKCPNTCRNVQHWLDDDEDVPDSEYEVVKCAACAKLHFVNRRTGDLLGAEIESR